MPSNNEEEIFQIASELAGAQRDAYLEAACAGDEALRARLDRLLAAYETDGFMHDTACRPVIPNLDRELARWHGEKAGDHIGPYRLIEELGSGGFGTVWQAAQERPVRREVALKIIKLGMDTREVIARFEQERQALALMDHSGIARVFDAGATESGRPYFVMELIRGVRVTDFCDAEKLSPEERLALFIEVCEAVLHAHQKGLIHRDLKPSNILVTVRDGTPVPKVIDFGVAKATEGRLTDLTLHTAEERIIGTPVYMSPEQAAGGANIDTRSDIYALGVLLYELLAGRTPFDVEELTRVRFSEMRRVIRERDPLKPSTLVQSMTAEMRTSVSQQRRCDPVKLRKTLRGDLDWIVMKALEKNPARRYQTANALAAEVRRYLAREPVEARPPSHAYRFHRMVQRNKLAFAAGAAISLAVLGGMTASLFQAKRANSALADLRRTAPLFAEQARALVARERIDEAVERLEYAARLEPTVADYVAAQGDLRQAQLRLTEAAQAYRAALKIAPDHARAQANLALSERLLAAQGDAPQLPREGLAELFRAMQHEGRAAAELLPVARLLGEEMQLTLGVWRDRLATLPIPPGRPLAQRLEMREDGRLALDLSETGVSDLALLEGMPVASLNLTGCGAVRDLRPLRGLPLRELLIRGTGVRDLSPLSAFSTLEHLNLPAEVRDLSGLRGLRLRILVIHDAGALDLEPLRGMPLTALYMQGSRIGDLTPLAGMPLEALDARNIPARDFSALAGAPLTWLLLTNDEVRDLAFVRGMPLQTLVLSGCKEARNFAALASLSKLELLVLPETCRTLPEDEAAAIDALRTLPGLRQISCDLGAGQPFWLIPTAEAFWKDRDRERKLFATLRADGHPFDFRRENDGTWYLRIRGVAFNDLSILMGLPISELFIFDTGVSDLTALAGMPLKRLTIGGCPVTDLSPLRGLPLELLHMSPSPAESLAPLAGMPLKSLHLGRCPNLAGFEWLAKIPALEELWLPMQADEIEFLREMPNLQRLGYSWSGPGQVTTVADFWKTWDGRPWYRALREAGFQFHPKQRLSGYWEVTITDPAFWDATIFRGTSVRALALSSPAFSDLAPLRDLPVDALDLRGSGVTDLSPLAGCGSLQVMHLPKGATNPEVLRALPNLKKIGYDALIAPAEFWEKNAGKTPQ